MIADEIVLPENDPMPDVQRLRLEPGDILVAEFSVGVTKEIASRFTRVMNQLAPGVQVLCIAGDLELSIVNRDQISLPKDPS